MTFANVKLLEGTKGNILEIAKVVLGLAGNNGLSENEILSALINESRKAITFISLLEEEFDLEFDDDDIDLDFFESTDNILKCLKKHGIN